MSAPYVQRSPGHWLSAEDWNLVQVRMREDIAGHAHRPGSLSGAAIDPGARLAFASVEVDGELRVGGRSLVERARALVPAPRQAELAPKLPSTGGVLSGELTVTGQAQVQGDVDLSLAPSVGGRAVQPPRPGPPRALRGPALEIPFTVSDDAIAPAVFEFVLDQPSLVELVARLTVQVGGASYGHAAGGFERWSGGAWSSVGPGISVGGGHGRPHAGEALALLVLEPGPHRLRLGLSVRQAAVSLSMLAIVRPLEGT